MEQNWWTDVFYLDFNSYLTQWQLVSLQGCVNNFYIFLSPFTFSHVFPTDSGVNTQGESPSEQDENQNIEIKLLTLFKQKAWLRFTKQEGATTDTPAHYFLPIKGAKSLSASLVLSHSIFSHTEMTDDPPLWQWQAGVGDGIARARNIDKKTKSAQSTATGNRKEKLKL